MALFAEVGSVSKRSLQTGIGDIKCICLLISIRGDAGHANYPSTLLPEDLVGLLIPHDAKLVKCSCSIQSLGASARDRISFLQLPDQSKLGSAQLRKLIFSEAAGAGVPLALPVTRPVSSLAPSLQPALPFSHLQVQSASCPRPSWKAACFESF